MTEDIQGLKFTAFQFEGRFCSRWTTKHYRPKLIITVFRRGREVMYSRPSDNSECRNLRPAVSSGSTAGRNRPCGYANWIASFLNTLIVCSN